jgi:hypothetical protein
MLVGPQTHFSGHLTIHFDHLGATMNNLKITHSWE